MFSCNWLCVCVRVCVLCSFSSADLQTWKYLYLKFDAYYCSARQSHWCSVLRRHRKWCSCYALLLPLCLHAYLCSCLSDLLNRQTHSARSLCLEVNLMGFSCDCVSSALLWQSPQFKQELDLLPSASISLSSTNTGRRDRIWQVQHR